MTRLRPTPASGDRTTKSPSHTLSKERRHVTPDELREWIECSASALTERWLVEVRARGGGLESGVEPLLSEFLGLLVRFLPASVSAIRDQVEPLYQQAAEYYGNLGAMRGLAAGEPVEEFQLLRGVLLRALDASPPATGNAVLGLRESLHLHRWLDLGVTYTSVGHTDTLFFNLYHGAGAPGVPTSAFLDGAREQVDALGHELDRVFQSERRGRVLTRS